MVEPDKKDHYHSADLEDTVRNLREENAKLLQLLRSQGLLPDNQNGKSDTSISSTLDSTNLTFDHSDLTLTTNTISTTNQITHQHINNHGSTNQQNYNEQTIHGNQSNITPNFNTVIQTTTQPFVQNNSNTLVQNNTNLIQPINLVNFNNVSLDSIQSFFASQNNLVYLSQTSSTTSTTTTTTTSSANSITNLNETLTTNTHSILPSTSSSSSSSSDHQISIRPKPSLIRQHQELVPVIPKIKTDQYESITRQLTSSSSSTTSNNDLTNLLDNDSNDSKQKHPRPIRPKPSSRSNSLQMYKSVVVNETKSSSTSSTFSNNNPNNSPTVSLFSSPTCLSPSLEHQLEHPPQLLHSKSLDLSVPPTNNILSSTSLPTAANKKSNKNRIRNRKQTSTTASSVILPSTSQTLIPIAPNFGRPLAPAPLNVQRTVTSNNPITKRSTTNKRTTKRNSKTLVQCHSESILQHTSSSPPTSFAESISGLLENFDQELIASNFLPSQTTTSNILTDEHNSIISSNTNIVQTLDNLDLRNLVNGAVQRQESYHITTASMPTLDEFNDRLDNDTNPTTQDFSVENEQITSFMSEEDMRLVEMNFDENSFLKQFDLDDPGIKLTNHSDQNIFANILTNNNDLIQTQQITEQSITHQNPPPPLPVYPGSSLINNNVFTTVVPLSLTQPINTSFVNNTNTTRLLPEEGVQLTARHIEPSQVATYESVKYQDILDDLVMVTDQDALRHAQAAAADDPTIESTDFSFALLEATNEIIKTTNIQIIGESSAAFNELQYFYPIEQEQELLEKQLDNCHDKQQEEMITNQQPIVILEKLQSDILATADLNHHKNILEDNIINTSITDLSSILQFESVQSPIQNNHLDTSTTDLITPIRQTKTKSNQMNFDELLPSSKSPENNSINNYSSQQITDTSSKPCILFEPISSPSNSISPNKTTSNTQNEMIIDSGCLDEFHFEKTNSVNNQEEIEDLLRDTTDDPYEIVENQGQTFIKNNLIVDNVDQLIEQIEPSSPSSSEKNNRKPIQILEKTFNRYQEKYHLNLQHQKDISLKKPQEQLLTIPTVKLKLNSIYSQQSNKKKKKQLSPSPEPQPEPISPPKQGQEEVVERPRLKITIRTKLPPPPPPSSSSETTSLVSTPSEDKTGNKKSRKHKKKKFHHHHHHNQKKKTIGDQLETEYAGLTRFERPLAQLYHQQSPPTPDETLPKDELSISSSPLRSLPAPIQSQSQSSTIPHSGFIIDEEQTPPSSITSMEHKQSPPPLLLNQTKNEKLKTNYSHLLNYDNNNDHQNNNTFITPPPEIDLNPQQQKTNSSYENFYQFQNTSPNKKKHHQRKSSVTSTTSSKSLTNTDYALDAQAIEPVSPTPLSTSKQKHTQHQSSSSSSSITTTNYNNVSPPYSEHQQQRQMKDHYSRKSSSSSSSSSRSSRPTTTATTTSSSSSHMYPQSRSLSNHNYRTPPDPSLLPPILPPPPPPIHLDPYAQSYHHFAPRAAAAPPPFFNFPFPHPFLNPHSTTTPSHFHPHHSMKYHHHHSHSHSHHPSHAYSTHQQQYPYHSHLQRQQQYNNSNYMSSRDHHSFDR